MQLIPKIEQFGSGDQSWLGSAHATDACQTVTLKGSALASFGGSIPSGTPLKKSATGGTFEPVTSADDTLAGFLFTTQSQSGSGDVAAPMLDHGRVRVDRLPASAFDVSTLTDASPHFIFVKES